MPFTSSYSIFLAWLWVRPKNSPDAQSHDSFFSPLKRGNRCSSDRASATAFIVFPSKRELNFLTGPKNPSIMLGMGRDQDDNWRTIGEIALAIAGKLTVMREKLGKDARTARSVWGVCRPRGAASLLGRSDAACNALGIGYTACCRRSAGTAAFDQAPHARAVPAVSHTHPASCRAVRGGTPCSRAAW